jgi:hypothetical protein
LPPEIPWADEVPLTPNVRPVIIVSGSDYDMGYQWYQQIVHIYGLRYLEGRKARKFTLAEQEALKAYQSFIDKHTPEMTELLKGMVAGAKDAGIELTYEDMLAKFCSGDGNAIRMPGQAQRAAVGAAGACPDCYDSDCSGFAAWGDATRDGRLIAGGSGDHEIRLGDNEITRLEYCIVMMPKNGNNFVTSTSTGCCWHAGMNNKGVTMFHHGATGYCGRYDEKQPFKYGVPNTMITMHSLRFANSAKEAQEIVLSLPSGDGRIGGAWADVNGTAFVIENRDNPRLIRKPGDNGERNFIYATNNLFSKELGSCYKSSPGLPVEFVPHAGWLGTHGSRESIPRNLSIFNLLHNYYGSVDLEFAKMIWRFPSVPPKYPTLEEADADFDRTQGRNWNSHLSETGNAMVGIMKPDNGNKGLYFVSQGCAARISNPHWPFLRVYRVEPTYTFFEMQLDASPRALAEAARMRAMYALAYADQQLRKLTYHDAAYAPLDDVFNKAVTQWQKGQFYEARAGKAEGNQAASFLARSARSFFRAQALGWQVYESLVPPPTNPEALGLRPWFGAWGEWATRDGMKKQNPTQ